MQINKNKVVSVHYTLMVEQDGQQVIADQSKEGNPLLFLFGAGMLLPDFEDNLLGKSKDDTFDFFISPENGYGVSDPQQMVRIPIDAFKNEQGEIDRTMLVVGNVLPMMDQNGQHFNGIVAEVGLDYVVMDFNHPLADKELHFTGYVVEVREATEEEIAHGHVHGPGGHHHH
ncbi:MAG: FKBP-type peptidyl-prolyl cis-trans isomerase [Chitinophagales bacterium]|nr:FKBP-type peptidyl-prolyl cis-trans isomerase [Chitinophagales bacterium]